MPTTLFEAYNGLKQAHSANEATEAMDTQTMIFSLGPMSHRSLPTL
jgi:hypothetical protein